MSRLRVHSLSMSVDGYVAGPDQDLENPLGAGGLALHEWQFPTRSFRKTMGDAGGTTGVDDAYVAAGFEGIGAWIMGRNMFGPIRGPWPDHEWKGWWGDSPPFGCPVFVLTHHDRPSFELDGGTVFHFVTDGIHAAHDRAVDAAGGLDVRLGGGAATVRQYVDAGLVDHLHLAIAPVVLGGGERLLDGVDLARLGYRTTAIASSAAATHVVATARPGTRGALPIEHTLAVVAVQDMATSRDWYEQVLGAPPTNTPMASLVEWQTTDSGWIQVTEDPARAGSSLVNLAVTDLDASIAALRRHAIEPHETLDAEKGVRLASFRDPDGNRLTLIGGFREAY